MRRDKSEYSYPNPYTVLATKDGKDRLIYNDKLVAEMPIDYFDNAVMEFLVISNGDLFVGNNRQLHQVRTLGKLKWAYHYYKTLNPMYLSDPRFNYHVNRHLGLTEDGVYYISENENFKIILRNVTKVFAGYFRPKIMIISSDGLYVSSLDDPLHVTNKYGCNTSLYSTLSRRRSRRISFPDESTISREKKEESSFRPQCCIERDD